MLFIEIPNSPAAELCGYAVQDKEDAGGCGGEEEQAVHRVEGLPGQGQVKVSFYYANAAQHCRAGDSSSSLKVSICKSTNL